MELLVDLACESEGFEYFRSDDPMQAAGFVVSDAVAGLWRAVRDQYGFATFVHQAAPQLLRWETGHGWTRYGWGSVAEKETSLASVLEGMLQAPDHWRAFADRYLEVLNEAADRTPGTPRHRSRSAEHDRTARARALADWHTLLVDRLVGSEDEDLLDRLVGHAALAGPERTFLQAQLAHRRGDDETARKLVHDRASRGCPATRASMISPDGSVRPCLHARNRLARNATDHGRCHRAKAAYPEDAMDRMLSQKTDQDRSPRLLAAALDRAATSMSSAPGFFVLLHPVR